MRIHTMGDGIFDETQAEVEGKPCLLLVADSRAELGAALQGIGLRDAVTIVKAAQPSGAAEEPK